MSSSLNFKNMEFGIFSIKLFSEYEHEDMMSQGYFFVVHWTAGLVRQPGLHILHVMLINEYLRLQAASRANTSNV